MSAKKKKKNSLAELNARIDAIGDLANDSFPDSILKSTYKEQGLPEPTFEEPTIRSVESTVKALNSPKETKNTITDEYGNITVKSPIKTNEDGTVEVLRNVEKKKNPIEEGIEAAKYIGEKAGAGLLRGGTGLVDSTLQTARRETDKGSKQSLLENILELTTPAYGMAKRYVENVNNKINTLKSDDDIVKKAINIGLQDAGYQGRLYNPLERGSEIYDLYGYLNPNATKEYEQIQKGIDSVSENVDKNLQKEALKQNDIVRTLGETADVMGNMAPSIATSMITKNPTLGIGAMGLQVKGQATKEAEQQGASLPQAENIGYAKGGIEAGTELLSGGLKKLGGGVLDGKLNKILNKYVTNPVLNFGLKEGAGILGETGEEIISDLSNLAIDRATTNPNATYTLDDLKNTIVQTALSTGGLNLLTGGYGKKAYNLNKQEINLISNTPEVQETINNVVNTAKQLNPNITIEEEQNLIQETTKEIQKEVENDINATINQVQPQIPTQTPLNTLNQVVQEQNVETPYQAPTPQITPLNEVNKELQETRQQDVADSVRAMNLEQEPQFTQKQGNYVYEKSDNSKIDNLRKDAATYLKEGEQTTNFVNTLEKLVKDKDIEIRFDTKLGNNVNGTYKNGVITINPNSNRAGEFVAIHELTHAIGTKPMIDMIQTYRKSNAEFNNAVERLLSTYKTTEINEEALGDIAGQLFGNQEYINNLSMENPSLFKKIYNEIKYLWHQFRGYKNQNQFIEDLRNKWESAYRNQKVQQKAKNSNIEMSNQTDSNGNMLSNEQVDYFKNSKVRDKDGNLIPVYHGTNYDFTIFKNPSRKFNEYASGKMFENTSISMFTDSQEVAQTYIDNEENQNKKPMEEYLNITNPYIIDAKYQNNKFFYDENGNSTNVNELVKKIYDSGKYDGVIIKNIADLGNYEDYDVTDGRQYATDYVVFESNQIKNIDNLTPTQDDDIRYSTEEVKKELDNSSFIIEKNEDVNKLELPKSPYQTLRPNVRGGWNIDKIQKQLKNESSNRVNSKDLSKFDNLDDLMNNVYYHGSISAHDNLKAGSTLQENQRTGGYGEEYHSISLSGNKNIASNFASMGQNGTVMPVILKKNANVIEMPNIEDSIELEDILPELWNKGVDAVKIGDWDIETKGYGEQELVILNPRAIMTMPQGTTYFQNYHKPKFQNMTKEEILETLTKTKERALNDPKLKPGQAEEIESRYDKLIKYSKDNQTWREYLEKEFPNQGTRTDLQGINERNKPKQENKTTQEEKPQEIPKNEVKQEVKKSYLTTEEQNELENLRELDNTGLLEETDADYKRLQELEKKSQGNIKSQKEVKKPKNPVEDSVKAMNLQSKQFKQEIKDTNKTLNLEKEENKKYSINENIKDDYVSMKVDKAIQKNAYKNVNKATKTAENYLKFDREQKANFKDSIKKLSLKTREQLVNSKTYNQVKDIVNNFANVEYNFVDEELKSIKKEIRNIKINIPAEIRQQITDYSDFRKQSKLNITKDGKNIDSVWQELSNEYPHIFSSDIQAEADMLYALSDLMNKDVKITEKYRIPDSDLKYATDKIYNSLLNNSITQTELDSIQEDLQIKAARRTRQVVQNELLNQMGITLEDIETGKDINAVRSQLLDPRRLNEEVFSPKVAKKINDATVNFVSEQEANSNRFKNKERQEIKDLGIKAHSKESAAVQKYGEKEWINDKGELLKYGDEQLAKEFPNVETQEKIKNAARVLRNKYDNYIDKINVSLEEMGYDPIPKRKDYFKHFYEISDKLSQWGVPFNANSMNEDLLPTDINGLTDEFKPGKNWFASAQQRTGKKTVYDAITGIDQYLDGASNLIFHTESIQRYRTLSKFIRDTYGQVNGLDNAANLSEAQIQKRIEDIQSNKLSRYAAWLDEQANAMAGKKGKIDRGIEEFFGRRVYSALNTLKSQVGSNMTGFNVRSAMTNFASAIQGASKVKKTAFLKGTLSTLQNMVNNDGLIDKSNFLTNRFGSDSISKKAWQKVANAGQIFMTGTDYFTANQIWRSKYFENMSKGMSEKQAIKNADDFTARIMGDRSKGQTAAAFNSKTLGFLTQFQLEVNNQWQSIIHDNKIDIKTGNKSGATVLFQLGQLAAMSNLFNLMMKGLTGSDVMFDPIDILKGVFKPDDDDKDKDLSERMREALGKIVDQLPMTSVFTGGRIPIGEAFKGVSTGAKYLTGGTNKWGQPLTTKDVKKDMLEALPYWILPTGWGQIRKTKQGLSMYSKDKPVAGSYTDSGNLRFTADTSLSGKTKSALFGQYSSKEAQDYIKGGFKTITKGNNIDELKNLGYTSSQYKKYRQELNAAGRKNQEKIDYIMGLDIPKKEKDVMASRVLRKPVNTNDIKKFDTLIEFNKWYKKNNN